MAWTQEDLDRIDAAITSGVRSITFADGRRTEYQTVADMRLLRGDIAAAVGSAAAQSSGRRRFIVGRIGRR